MSKRLKVSWGTRSHLLLSDIAHSGQGKVGMSDIFISYARPDLKAAKRLAGTLERQGWSVFWDRTIPAGRAWREVIGAALADARCIVVLWSKHSVTSHWVLEEADYGLRRRVLIPALIDGIAPPFGFGSIQAADLSSWSGGDEDTEIQRFLIDVSGALGPAPIVTEDGYRRAEAEARQKAEEQRRQQLEAAARRRIELETIQPSMTGRGDAEVEEHEPAATTAKGEDDEELERPKSELVSESKTEEERETRRRSWGRQLRWRPIDRLPLQVRSSLSLGDGRRWSSWGTVGGGVIGAVALGAWLVVAILGTGPDRPTTDIETESGGLKRSYQTNKLPTMVPPTGCGDPELQQDEGDLVLRAYVPTGSKVDSVITPDLRKDFAGRGVAVVVAGLSPAVCMIREVASEATTERAASEVSLAGVAEGARARLRDGDKLVIELPAADEPRYVAIDYVVNTGEVLHLHPKWGDDGYLPAGQSLRLGDGADGPAWEVGAPFGDDLVLVTLSSLPFASDLPAVEPADAYRARLLRRLQALSSGPLRLLTRVVTIEAR